MKNPVRMRFVAPFTVSFETPETDLHCSMNSNFGRDEFDYNTPSDFGMINVENKPGPGLVHS